MFSPGKAQLWSLVLGNKEFFPPLHFFDLVYTSRVLLKQIGAAIIAAGIFLGMIAINVCRPGTWCEKYAPLSMFAFLLVGAAIGVAGFISSAIHRHTDRERKTEESLESNNWLEALLSAMFNEMRRWRVRGPGL
jgi:hypothetical protein